MVASKLIGAISALVEEKIALFLWGSPGVGKSSIVREVAKTKGLEVLDLRLSLLDPTDLKGIPFLDKDARSAIWAPPSFLPRSGKGILFLDELNSAPPSVQAAAYQLILDRRVGEYALPDEWAIIAAGNLESDRAFTYKLPSALANRFVHFEMEVDALEWRSWAFKSGVDPRIIAYIDSKNEHLFSFDPASNAKSFATPRSWEAVSKILKSGIDESLLLGSIAGAVGREIAVSFLSFVLVMESLPDPKAILNGSEKTQCSDASQLFVLISLLVSTYLADPSKEALANLLSYSLDLKSEFSLKLVRDLQNSGVNLEKEELFGKWCDKFSYLLT